MAPSSERNCTFTYSAKKSATKIFYFAIIWVSGLLLQLHTCLKVSLTDDVKKSRCNLLVTTEFAISDIISGPVSLTNLKSWRLLLEQTALEE